MGHRNTFPPALKDVCFVRRPPIVLSHWDWDHWSSAQRFTDALKMSWVVPRQSLGPVQRVFLYNLSQYGCVLFWPRRLPALRCGQVEIRKCTGTGKNHSGLAVSVASPKNSTDDDILLTGDCDYRRIPNLENEYRHVLVPHHGAQMPSAAVPRPSDQVRSCATISRGHKNQWQHPRDITIDRHRKVGWTRYQDLGRTPRIHDSGYHHLLFWDDDLMLWAQLVQGWPSIGRRCFQCPKKGCDMKYFKA